MNRLVLIGNGFDLAHGLNTSYEHFIYWYLDQCGNDLLRTTRREVSDGLCSFKINDGVRTVNWATAFQGYYFQKNTLAPWKGIDAFLRAIEDKEFCKFSFISELLQRIWNKVALGWVDIEYEYFSLLTKGLLTT